MALSCEDDYLTHVLYRSVIEVLDSPEVKKLDPDDSGIKHYNT